MEALVLHFEPPDIRSTAGNAWIVLGRRSMDEEGRFLLTPQCATIEEFEANVAQLQKELQRAVQHARKKFAQFAGAPPIDPFARK
jgi:hypothetical protein